MLCFVSACGTLSLREEQQLGEQFAYQAKRELILVRDRVVVDYIEDLGRRILAASGPQPFRYHFYVVEDPNINAFAGPAGYIFIHTETILKSRNVSELAGVMGHEIGHVVHRHVAENYNRSRTTGIAHQLGVLVAGVLGGGMAAQAMDLGGGLAGMAYLNSFGRDAEREADAFAVETLPRAGIDPRGIVSFFETLMRSGGPGAPSFLSSHPATQERISNTSAMIAQQPQMLGLRAEDGGRLEIIQRRIALLTR